MMLTPSQREKYTQPADAIVIVKRRTLGGEGSGNFGHAGRPGEVGGSGPGGGSALGEALSKKRWFFGGSATPAITSTAHLREPIFLTTDPEAADWFAENRGPAVFNRGQGGTIYSFHVDVKNPFHIRSYDDATKLKQILEDVGIKVELTGDKSGWDWFVPAVNIFSGYGGENPLDISYIPTARQALKLAGYDALYGSDPLMEGEIDALVIFDKTKLKSSFRAASLAEWLRLLGGVGSGYFGHRGRPGEVGGSTEGSGEPQVRSIKAQRALKAFKPIHAQAQRYAEKNELVVREMIGGTRTDDNEPVDVVAEVEGKTVGLEVKTMINNTNDKITMRRAAVEKKNVWARKHRAEVHTVVIDDRGKLGHKDYSGHRIYYMKGTGSFRLGAMTPVKDAKHLKELLAQ